MRVEAVVMRVEGSLAWVKVSPDGAGCGRCHEPGGCRTEMLSDMLGARCREYAVDNGLHAGTGARVAIEVADGLPLRAAAWAYGLPLLALLVGAAVGRWLLATDVGSAVGAGLGMLLAWVAVGRHGRQAARGDWKPRLVEILS